MSVASPRSGATRRARPGDRAVVALFSATLFLSAALLFSVQPMFARFVLPLFGGTPAVWNTSMVFFQTTLLAGYLYAHATTRRLGVRRQAALHLGVVLLPLLVLPLAVPDGWAPTGGESPVPLLLGLLLVAVGPPFFVVATTTPLLQRWLAGTDHPAARDPYFLYRASNLGSVLGLLAYPLAVEPTLRLAEQGIAWAAGYVLLAAFVAACAAVVWRSGRRRAARAPAIPSAPDPAASIAAERPVTINRRLRWIGLAFVPSSLMLGVTSYMTVDLAPVPLLWSVPLSLYLVSFIVAFAPGARNKRRHRRLVLILPIAALLLSLLILLEAREPLWLIIPIHLTGFLVAALVCHGELAHDRPATRSLTEFYIWVAVGGVLGGIFNALLAPVLFDSLVEYPLVIALACLCLPGRPGRLPAGPQTRWLDFAAPALLGAVVAVILALSSRAGPELELAGRGFALSVAAGVALNFARRPLRFALSVGAILLAGALLAPGDRVLYQERSFFGVNRVEAEPGGFHRLVNGTTVHGGQYRSPGRALEPTTYYHRSGPIGQFLTTVPRAGRTDRVAVLGLGGGGMACHARAGERWTFYEIDPTVARLARDPRLFTWMRDCPGHHEVVLGDARLSLADARNRSYGLIVADAFSSDALPVHLLTREAVRLYRSKLTADGVLALHISNRYLDLAPVAAALARDAGLTCLSQAEPEAAARRVPGKAAAHWVLMTARPDRLGPVASDPRWRPCRPQARAEVWTDDFSNIVEALDLEIVPAGSGERVERASSGR